MAQGFGKRQESCDIVQSSGYVAKCVVAGMGKVDVPLQCETIVGLGTDEAREVAQKHAEVEAPKEKRFKGRRVTVKSVKVQT